jgi:hypothetical protein
MGFQSAIARGDFATTTGLAAVMKNQGIMEGLNLAIEIMLEMALPEGQEEEKDNG